MLFKSDTALETMLYDFREKIHKIESAEPKDTYIQNSSLGRTLFDAASVTGNVTFITVSFDKKLVTPVIRLSVIGFAVVVSFVSILEFVPLS